MLNDSASIPKWIKSVDHPTIVRTCHTTTGKMIFEGASPHLIAEYRDLFLKSLRHDISAFNVEHARPIFRKVVQKNNEIAPETCTPYVDANALGFYIRNLLPIVFVRTRKGELLPNARVALKYLRENASEFKDVLHILSQYSHRIFKPEVYDELKPRYPNLFSDVCQPYSAFSNSYMAMLVGCYIMTPKNISTFLGPPINQPPLLRIHSGLMESEWHHSELFLVFDCPKFDERVFVIEPDTVLAQFYFVDSAVDDLTEILFSETHKGADPDYHDRSVEAGLELLQRGKPFVISKTTGVMSLSVSCPHCWVSITAAAEGGVPEDHVQIQDFYQGYKNLRAEYNNIVRKNLKI